MYKKSLLWLVCATTLTGHPALAKDKAETDKPGYVLEKPAAKPASRKVTLDTAIAAGLTQSPRLEAFRSGISAAQGERRQAGALPNPEVSYSKENTGGGAAYKVISPAQDVYAVSQLIEVGGKVSSRKHIADKGLQIAGLDYQTAALDLIRDIHIAYADAVAADESVQLATEQKALAEDVMKSVSVRVDAAAAPLIQKSRAEVERSTAAIALDTAKREKEIARNNLAALMGENKAGFTLDKKAFFKVAKPDDGIEPEKLKTTPDVLKLNSSLEQSKARLELEKANAIPDPRITAGLTRIPSARDQAFMVGVSLPIPILNGNRGNIDRARSEYSRTEQNNRQTALLLNADLSSAQQQMENAYFQSNTLKTKILPSAQKAFGLAREGYGLGRFPYLEVLDAQRSLFSVKQQHILALRNYHIARATVERLTAEHLPLLNTGESHAD